MSLILSLNHDHCHYHTYIHGHGQNYNQSHRIQPKPCPYDHSHHKTIKITLTLSLAIPSPGFFLRSSFGDPQQLGSGAVADATRPFFAPPGRGRRGRPSRAGGAGREGKETSGGASLCPSQAALGVDSGAGLQLRRPCFDRQRRVSVPGARGERAKRG